MKLEELANPHIRELEPYEPGQPIEEVERELGIRGVVKLASNENPLGPSPLALAALRDNLEWANRYPDGGCFALRARLAPHLGVKPDQLVFGCGGDEILELVVKTFLAPGDEAVMPWPSFAMYPVVVKGMGGVSTFVPLDSAMCHDFSAMAAAIGSGTKLVFVCNPNNPTGTSFGAEAFAGFVADLPEHVVLVIDEAYYEFARRSDFPDSIALLEDRPATLVLRTFSKLYGLAGLRVGYGIGSPELIGLLERARHPFNVNRLAEVAACAALDDEEHVRQTLSLNASGADYITDALTTMGYEVWPTDANFLLAKLGRGSHQALLERGVIARPLKGFGLDEHLRISIGRPEENEKLVKALQEIRSSSDPGGRSV